MNNKKIGIVLLILTISLIGVFIFLLQTLQAEATSLGCFENSNCQKIEQGLSVLHFAFGAFGFLLALGIYLIFFSRGERAIMHKLEQTQQNQSNEEKYLVLKMGLDPFEQEALTAVRDQSGITQNTLKLRTNMSKAKLSQVLQNLESKGLIKREKAGKTLAIHYTLKF